jgi:hypothetical protein
MRKSMQEQVMAMIVAGALGVLCGCPNNNNGQDAGADLRVAGDLATPPDQAVAPDLVTAGDLGGGSFRADVQPIFDANCSPCHTTQSPRAGQLDLAPGASYAALVGVNSPVCITSGTKTRVVAGQPAQSYLIEKLESATPTCGLQMPRGRTPLPTLTINIIRDWIASGAQNN